MTFTIIAPSGNLYQRVNGILHHRGQPDIGIQSNVYLLPPTVSFHFLYQKETDATGYGTGVWTCFNGVSHNPNKALLRVGPEVAGLGSLVGVDTEYSGECAGYAQPFPPSVEDDDIPQWYAVGPSGALYEYSLVLQSANLTAAGVLTETKGASTGSTTVNSPTSYY